MFEWQHSNNEPWTPYPLDEESPFCGRDLFVETGSAGDKCVQPGASNKQLR